MAAPACMSVVHVGDFVTRLRADAGKAWKVTYCPSKGELYCQRTELPTTLHCKAELVRLIHQMARSLHISAPTSLRTGPDRFTFSW
jgi:hypothetical protein